MLTSIHGISELLNCWLSQQVTQEGFAWLSEKQKHISADVNLRVFFAAFSAVPRYTGKEKLELTNSDLQAADRMRRDWYPGDWSVDQAARTLLLLALPQEDMQKYLLALDQIFSNADVGELVALYQSLPLLPFPEQLRKRAAEGVRSNMTSVFNAVALRNPYPADYFDNIAWNQMILKALFVGSPLYLIQGFDRRANPELARMLIDYVRERLAAKRSVSPELWRAVGQFADAEMLTDIPQFLEIRN
ncbi:MAG TPA: hypothetical protein DDW76_12300 [Cyanobacteria bacterium UBA11369]|nr:hypothetical protein [Cyanobacteria bacterium UBA11371]HBE49548.1 hypothetical protein [Cyanobacteria bacterium UBA11369]